MHGSDGLHEAITERLIRYRQSTDYSLLRAAVELQHDLVDYPHSEMIYGSKEMTFASYTHLTRKVMEQHIAVIKGRRVTCACYEFTATAPTAALRKEIHQEHVAEKIVALLM